MEPDTFGFSANCSLTKCTFERVLTDRRTQIHIHWHTHICKRKIFMSLAMLPPIVCSFVTLLVGTVVRWLIDNINICFNFFSTHIVQFELFLLFDTLEVQFQSKLHFCVKITQNLHLNSIKTILSCIYLSAMIIIYEPKLNNVNNYYILLRWFQ